MRAFNAGAKLFILVCVLALTACAGPPAPFEQTAWCQRPDGKLVASSNGHCGPDDGSLLQTKRHASIAHETEPRSKDRLTWHVYDRMMKKSGALYRAFDGEKAYASCIKWRWSSYVYLHAHVRHLVMRAKRSSIHVIPASKALEQCAAKQSEKDCGCVLVDLNGTNVVDLPDDYVKKVLAD